MTGNVKVAPVPDGWTRVTLGSLGTWLSGGTPSKARQEYWVGTTPWCSPKDMKCFLLNDTEDHVSDEGARNGTTLAPKGSVFIVVRGMILARSFPVCIAGRSMAFNQDVKAIIPSNDVNGGFVAHWMNGGSDAFLRMTTESTHGTKRLQQSELQAVELNLPPLAEQRTIATILDTVDETIRRTEQVIEKLKQMKQGLLHDLLTRGIDENGELRDPACQPEQFKDSELGRIPKDCEVGKLREVLDGHLCNGVFKAPARVGSGVPLVNVGDLYKEFGLDLKAVERFEAMPQEIERFRVLPGDIFFTRSSLNLSGIGWCNITRIVEEPTVFDCHLVRARANIRMVSPAFLGFWCRSLAARKFLISRAKQVTMTTISQPDLYPLPVLLPPLHEQHRIVDRMDDIDRSIACEQKYLVKTKQHKRALMDDLLNGHVRVGELKV